MSAGDGPSGAPERVAGASSDGLRLDELARELPMSAEIVGDAAVRVCGVRHDSRAVERGDLFVARPGATVDGARFIGDAVARGAPAVMLRRGAAELAGLSVPAVVVDDAALGLAYAASAVYGHPSFSMEVTGVTGTNGKTTVVHLVRAAIDGALGKPSCGVLGTVGHSFGDWHREAEHTTPEADEVARVLAQFYRGGATYAAMEVSSHALEQARVRGVQFRVAALTNFTQDHLDFHGSMRAYAEAKARLFTELGPASVVLNVDDAFGQELVGRVRAPVVRVSARAASPADADVAPRQARVDAHGIEAMVRTPDGDVRLHSRLVGGHNLENLLVALGVACALGLDAGLAADALSREPGAPGRLERCDAEGDDVTVLVDYAHTHDALARVLDAARAVVSAESGRLWCVFGCGGDRDRAKRAPMGEAVGRRVDVAVVTSDNPRTENPADIAAAVIDGVRRAGAEPIVEPDRRRAIEFAVGAASPGDVVVLAGKGHEAYQQIGNVKQPFDDRIEARRALETRRRARAVRGGP
jgi:UDP-N-acetylmuramoyl-L-alanyl-D-glutamate--2,6-diaminopimelate ligase